MSDEMRASDAEREQVVERLRADAAEGRLDVEELEQRLDAAFGAKTRTDLAELERDLPSARARRRRARGLRSHTRVFVAVNAGLIVLWALTGMGYFWPIWPLLGWGIGVLGHARGAPVGCGRHAVEDLRARAVGRPGGRRHRRRHGPWAGVGARARGVR